MKNNPWDLKQILIEKIKNQGGFVNCHAHFDRAYTISEKKLKLAQSLMEKKWFLVDEIRRRSSEEDYYHRIKRALDHMIKQKVKVCASFIDVDPLCELRALNAALKLKIEYKNKIKFVIINQTSKGVINHKARKFVEKAAEFVDILGGLPSFDRPCHKKALNYLLSLAKSTGKKIHVHIDQENNPKEKDTELLARYTIKHKLEGKVVAVHSISLAAQNPEYRKKTYSLIKNAGISVIICPSAAVNMKEVPFKSYVHKPIAPVSELIENDIKIGIGVDNILDIYEPFLDGDLWFETRLLMEVSRFYDIDAVSKMASINGRNIVEN